MWASCNKSVGALALALMLARELQSMMHICDFMLTKQATIGGILWIDVIWYQTPIFVTCMWLCSFVVVAALCFYIYIYICVYMCHDLETCVCIHAYVFVCFVWFCSMKCRSKQQHTLHIV